MDERYYALFKGLGIGVIVFGIFFYLIYLFIMWLDRRPPPPGPGYFSGPKCPSCNGTNTRGMDLTDKLHHGGLIGTIGKTHRCHSCGRTF